MRIARSDEELRRALAVPRRNGRGLALVPTMGALHTGHLALVDAARAATGGNGAVMASIFVNPLQFDHAGDLDRYPRTEERDLALLEAAGCDLAWLPTADAMYPPGTATTVAVEGPSEGWEGAHRPGHFRGMATVCAKLFLRTGADLAAFGEKDWQQLQVVRRMVRDLNIPTRILPVPTMRDADGLALSSRNRFLSASERDAAPQLFAALRRAAARISDGAPAGAVLAAEAASLSGAGLAPDYLALVDAESMRALDAVQPGRDARIVAAARLGTVRLLDNVSVPAGR